MGIELIVEDLERLLKECAEALSDPTLSSFRQVATGIRYLVSERDELRQQLEAIKQSSKRPAPCENLCEARAFEIEIRQLKAQIAKSPAPEGE